MKDLKDYMRQAGEVTYADAHKRHRNEGLVNGDASIVFHCSGISDLYIYMCICMYIQCVWDKFYILIFCYFCCLV